MYVWQLRIPFGKMSNSPQYLLKSSTTRYRFVIIAMTPIVGKGVITVAFFRPSVYSSIAYTANNLRTQRPSVPKFGMKVPHLRCDSHTSFKVKRSKVRVTDGRGHTVLAVKFITFRSILIGRNSSCTDVIWWATFGLQSKHTIPSNVCTFNCTVDNFTAIWHKKLVSVESWLINKKDTVLTRCSPPLNGLDKATCIKIPN